LRTDGSTLESKDSEMTLGKRVTAAVVLAGAMMFGGSARADVAKGDWPQFRGPTRDNVSKETGLLKEWPKGGPALAWRASGIGDGHSSIAVADGKIFTSGREGDAVYAFALNEADGKQVWKAKVGGLGDSIESQGGKGPRSTPTVDGDTVYVEGPAGDVVALGTADGKERWHASLTKDFGGRVPQWGYSDSPLVDGEHLICLPGGKTSVVALDKRTGKEAWRVKELGGSAHYVSSVAADIDGVPQVIVSTDRTLAGLAPADGTVLWKANRKGRTAVIPTPIVHDDLVYVTTGYGEGDNLFKIKKEGDKFSVEPGYSTKNMVNHHGGVVLVDGYVYGYSDGKGWVCQDLKTGQIKWKEKEAFGKGTVTYADGRLYLRDERSGAIGLIEASPEGYKEVGRFTPPDLSKKPYWPHLVIANGKLYVRDMDNLFCYDVKAK
jgi:outer membrane protein assembly factor BamB